MNKILIYLNDFEKIRKFIKVADTIDCGLKLASGSYAVDGQSTIGIFNLDLSQAIEVSITNHEQIPEKYMKEFENFTI